MVWEVHKPFSASVPVTVSASVPVTVDGKILLEWLNNFFETYKIKTKGLFITSTT